MMMGFSKTVKMGLVVFFSMFFLSTATVLAGGEQQRLKNALTVLKEAQAIPEKTIPKDLFKRCRAIAIFPSVYKGSFVIGGSFGRGVIFARDPKSNKWFGPVFLTMGGGSFGWQIGVKSTDLILVVMNDRGLRPFFRGNFTLGGEVGVSAGPVGRELEASTDVTLRSEIYSYSRSKGFFAGISLEGTYIAHDYKADEAFWKKPYTPREILEGRVPVIPESAKAIITYLEKLGE